jgi:polyisoprenyl-teichoic acid--peptidoglycan teichoic acid transferase
MNKQRPSIDGFVPRRSGSQLGELHQIRRPEQRVQPIDRSLHTGESDTVRQNVGFERPTQSIGRSDIDESLRQIDTNDAPVKKLSRRKRRQLEKASKPRSKAKRIIKWFFILLLIALIGVGGYIGVKTFLASGNVLRGSLFDIVQSQPLKTDANGRSNFVVFGTAEDDEGGEHGGANLTDSIMVISVNQTTKDAYMISIPRDLWVTYADTCTVGNQGKLNAAYYCASDDGANEAAGAAALQAQVGEILGLDVQYYIHLNFTAVVDAVDAVGGVSVLIESDDPRGIFDDNFDWKCNYKCNYVKYPNGQTPVMDGEHALALARARGASGNTYGLPNANFDREKNQQKIIKALREKALSAGTLTNVGAVTGLIDALGNNLRTNIETKEIRTLMTLGTDISDSNIRSLPLVGEDVSYVKTGSINGQSIVQPSLGIYDFSGIQAYIQKNLTSDPVEREAAEIVVLNGSGTPGVGQAEADILTDEGYTVSIVDNAPDATYAPIEIYHIGTDNTATAAALAKKYGVTIKTTAPPLAVSDTTAFVIIVGTASN